MLVDLPKRSVTVEVYLHRTPANIENPSIQELLEYVLLSPKFNE